MSDSSRRESSGCDSFSAGPQWFATTHWSVVLAAGSGTSANAEHALAQLCESYWYPLYAYVRRQGYSPHDAQDLTQAFFAQFLEKKYLRAADRERGRFRSFLLISLKPPPERICGSGARPTGSPWRVSRLRPLRSAA